MLARFRGAKQSDQCQSDCFAPQVDGRQVARSDRVRLPACPRPTILPQTLTTSGDRIKKRWLERGLFETDVAKRLGLDVCTITNWEENRTASTLRRLSKVIGFMGYKPTLEHTGCRGPLHSPGRLKSIPHLLAVLSDSILHSSAVVKERGDRFAVDDICALHSC